MSEESKVASIHTLVKAIKLFLTVSLGAAPVAPVAVFADMAVEWK